MFWMTDTEIRMTLFICACAFVLGGFYFVAWMFERKRSNDED